MLIADIHYLVSNFIVVFVMLRGRAISLLMPLFRRAVASTDFNVWLEDLPRDLEDIFQFDLL